MSYRETVKGRARVWGECIHQTGGHGLYAKVEIEIEPYKGEQSVTVEPRLKGGVIPPQFIPVIESALRDEAGRVASWAIP